MIASVGWGQTTYKLEQVTSVQAGELYVFEQNGHVAINTVSNSALQTTTDYKTSGLTGTETYVWELKNGSNGFRISSMKGSSNEITNTSSTAISLKPEGSNWKFTFENGVALIQNIDNNNRYLGYSTTTSYAYKAYATSDMSYSHAIKVYKLVEESGTTPVDPSVTTTTTINATGITNTDVNKGTAAGNFTASVTVTDDGSPVEGATVTWSGNNDDVATIDAATGAVTLVAAGTVTFTASYAGVQDEYKASSATYELTVEDSAPKETITFSEKGYDNGATVTSVVGNNYTVTFDKGTNSNAPKYYTTGTAIRAYGGNTFTVSSLSNTINKIVLTFATGEDNNVISTDCGSYANGTWTGDASSVKFTIGGTSGHRRISAITVYYAEIPVKAPAISLASGNYLSSQSVTLSCETEGADIYYTLDGTDPSTTSTKYTAAFTIDKTTTLKAIAIKGEDESAVASATYTFPVTYNNIAALIAAAPTEDVILKLTDAQVLYVNNKDMYIKDATGAIDFYDCGLEYTAGQILNGTAVVKYTLFNNLPEISKVDKVNSGITPTEGQAIPEEISAQDIKLANNVCQLVMVQGNYNSEKKTIDGVPAYNKWKIADFDLTNFNPDVAKAVAIVVPSRDDDYQAPSLALISIKEVPVVAAIGTKKYETLQEAFNAANDGETVTLLKDVDATAAMYSGDTRYNLWINKSITVDGTENKYSITVKGRGIGVKGASDKIDVTFKNTTVKNVDNVDGRCIDTRGNLNSLTLENATLTTAESEFTGYLQPLTIGGNQKEVATVTIKDSELITVEAANKGYAITTFNPVNMTIDGSTLKGWACLNLKAEDSSEGSHGSNISVTNSTLVSANGTPGETNAYCLIKIEDDDVNVTVSGSTININGADNSQSIVSFIKKDNQTLTSNCNVSLGEGNEVTLDNNFYFAVNESETSKLVISGGTFNVPVPEENCAEGMIPTTLGDGKFSVKVGQYLAQVGEQKFETFAEAVAALSEENNTITLLANVADAYTLDEGQTLNVIRGEYTLTVLAPDGNILQTAEADGVTTYSYAAPVAKIGETMYASLAEAVAAVPADGPETTITMLADASSDQITIPADKNIVIDFASCTVTPTGKWLIINNGALTLNNTAEGAGGITSTFKGLVDNYGTLAVNSGTYSTTAEIAFWNNNENSTITVNSGSVSSSAIVIVAENNSIVNVAGGTITATGEESYGIRSTSSKVNVSGGKVTAATEAILLQESSTATISGDAVVEVTGEETWGIVVLSNSTLTVKDNATITSSGFAISGNGNEGGTTVNIEGGIVTGGSAGIYQPQSGNLNITGGTISGETGVYVKSGELNVTGGEINGTGAKADYNFNGNGANPTGDALVIDNCGYPGGAPAASITGGTFTSTNAAAVASYAATDHTAIDKFVSGGTFSSAVPAEFCAEGYIPADLGDGKYGVKLYISAPIVFHDGGEYEDALTVAMAGEGTIKYQLGDGAEQTYTAPFTINETTTVKAWTEQDGAKSDEVSKTFTINKTEKPAINLNGYYSIKNNGNELFVNVAGRKTVTFVNEDASKAAAGSVIKVNVENGQVKELRSQGVDIPGYAKRAMNYVPELVKAVVERLGENDVIGEQGLNLIADEFVAKFDYNLYLEEANGGYRIYGKTPSMSLVVDFYAKNKEIIDSRLPYVEGFVEEILLKVAERLHHPDSDWAKKFKVHDIWALIVNEENKLTEPVDEASTAKFYTEVLSSEANIWNFAHETAMIYWDKVESIIEDHAGELGDYSKYLTRVKNVQPNSKYYIVADGSSLDFNNEANENIKNNVSSTIWTLEERSTFDVKFNPALSKNDGKELYTTLYTDFAYTLPEKVKALKVIDIDETTGVAETEEITDVIPAQTPVLLMSTDTENLTKSLTLSSEAGTAVTGNLLVGADYLINKYKINSTQAEGVLNMLKSLSESLYNDYEYLLRKNAGTVNNKYFFGLDDADMELCVYGEDQDCVVRNLGTGENQPLAFYGDWQAPKANQAFLVSETNPILLTQKGDVDRDGDVDYDDVKALVKIVLGEVTIENNPDNYDFDAAHVNEDEDINIADVTALVNILKPQPQD